MVVYSIYVICLYLYFFCVNIQVFSAIHNSHCLMFILNNRPKAFYLSFGIRDSAAEFVFSICIYNHRTTKTNQKYPSVNL